MSRSGTAGSGGRVTIKQVAERLGLSACTVSKILGNRMGSAKYRQQTILRVREVAGRMGYQANMLARALVEGRTWTIGLCVADIANPVFGEFASCFEREAAAAGYSTLVCNSGEDPDVEMRYVDNLLARRVDGIVISPVSPGVRALPARAAGAGCRVVLFDRDLPNAGAGCVQTDNFRVMRKLTARCLKLGHRRIGVLHGRKDDPSLRLRLRGIRVAAEAAGLDRRSVVVARGSTANTSLECGMAGMTELLARRQRPTLVIGLGNVLTQGAVAGAQESGLEIGRDISIAGFDDFAGAALMRPAITVVVQPVREMAAACAAMVCREQAGRSGRRLSAKMFPSRIVWRHSVQAASA